MMIFPVHIVGNCSPEGHKPGARRNGQEPSAWNGDVKNIGETNPCFTLDVALLGVKTDDPVQAGTLDQVAPVIQAGIAVTSAQSMRQQ